MMLVLDELSGFPVWRLPCPTLSKRYSQLRLFEEASSASSILPAQGDQ